MVLPTNCFVALVFPVQPPGLMSSTPLIHAIHTIPRPSNSPPQHIPSRETHVKTTQMEIHIIHSDQLLVISSSAASPIRRANVGNRT
ncbi:hypothetical protein K456DRAFT_52442, partial [Colletotrichum gloeosporioides 23]